MTVTYDRDQPTREYIAACEDVDELLDIRAEGLEVAEEIKRHLDADKLMPEPSTRWAGKASYARECWLRVARQATARLLEIAPDTLGIPEEPALAEPPLARNPRIEALEAQVKNLTAEKEALKMEVKRKMQEDIVFKREKLVWQERRDRDFSQAFLDLSKQMLPDALYREVLRATMVRVPETQMPPKQEDAA